MRDDETARERETLDRRNTMQGGFKKERIRNDER